jgi:hypothetical protein
MGHDLRVGRISYKKGEGLLELGNLFFSKTISLDYQLVRLIAKENATIGRLQKLKWGQDDRRIRDRLTMMCIEKSEIYEK